jgi:glycosyltransferase involved in cell wall biosynthesis
MSQVVIGPSAKTLTKAKIKKVRVLLLMQGQFPGYVAPVFKEIAKNLANQGYEVLVVAVGGGLTPSNESFEFKVHVIKPACIIKQYRQIILVSEGFDIVHYFLGKGFEFLPLFNRKAKFVFHFISVSVSGRFLQDWIINTLKKLQPIFSDIALYTDIELQKRIQPIFKKKCFLLPVGYASDLFYPCKPYEELSNRILIYHGSCHPARKLEQMIRVLSLLQNRYELVIIGKGPEKYIRELKLLAAELGCSHRLTFTEMPQDQIRLIIEKAYLCFSYVPVLECYQDQFVLKTIEYLACGRPVLTTNTSHNLKFQKYIGEENLLVCRDDVKEIAQAINSSDLFVKNFYDARTMQDLFFKIRHFSNDSLIKERLNAYYEKLLKLNLKF